MLIGINVDDTGKVTSIDWLNEEAVSYNMGKSVIDIIKSYDFQFEPALDTKGNPTSTILRLPVKITMH